jgi:RNA polymerase sigma-70 factor (ECF subfamily)
MQHPAALERLYTSHAKAVTAYARRRIDRAIADDVVSEVFLTAWRHIDEAPADERAWLLGIARKTLANQRRAVRRQVALFERMAAGHTGATEDPLPVDGGALRALAALRPSDRELLLLITWDEVTPGQAAQILGIRPSTLSMRLKRARERFARALDPADHPSTTASAYAPEEHSA